MGQNRTKNSFKYSYLYYLSWLIYYIITTIMLNTISTRNRVLLREKFTWSSKPSWVASFRANLARLRAARKALRRSISISRARRRLSARCSSVSGIFLRFSPGRPPPFKTSMRSWSHGLVMRTWLLCTLTSGSGKLANHAGSFDEVLTRLLTFPWSSTFSSSSSSSDGFSTDSLVLFNLFYRFYSF